MESPFRPADLTPGLRVIETLAWDDSHHLRLDRHVARAARTCAALGIPFAPGAFVAALPRPQAPARLRVTIDLAGTVEATATPMPPVATSWRVGVAAQRLRADDPWLRVKTTRRALYDEARAALPPGLDEMLFMNGQGAVCEGTITTLFFDVGQGLHTPPLTCGLLPGILREELLEEGRCREAVITLPELRQARIWLGNALRGMIPAQLVD